MVAVACEASGRRYKIRKVAEAADSVEQISQFAQPGAKLSISRNCDAGLPPVASGLKVLGIFPWRDGSPPLSAKGGAGASLVSLFRGGEITEDTHGPLGKSLYSFWVEYSLEDEGCNHGRARLGQSRR